MRCVGPQAGAVLNRLTGGLAVGQARTVGNSRGTFMAVHVEALGDGCFSVAHYYEQNGDLMADLEMVFWRSSGVRFYAVSFRQDSLGVYREGIVFRAGVPCACRVREQRDQAIFADQWMRNIAQQQRLDDCVLVSPDGETAS